jgi:hypothetical protein
MISQTPEREQRATSARGRRADLGRIVLVRRHPDVDGCLPDRSEAVVGPSDLVFLHAGAVAMAGRPGAFFPAGRGSFRVCRTSWHRRFPGRLPDPPFELSTLTRLIAHIAAGAPRVDSDGLGGACCSREAGDGGYLLEVAFAPGSPRRAGETVEWLLAAASLELDVRVLFSAEGLGHLRGDFARAWRQFVDFGLAELYAQTGPAADALDADARCIAAAEAVRLRGEARQVIVL